MKDSGPLFRMSGHYESASVVLPHFLGIKTVCATFVNNKNTIGNQHDNTNISIGISNHFFDQVYMDVCTIPKEAMNLART